MKQMKMKSRFNMKTLCLVAMLGLSRSMIAQADGDIKCKFDRFEYSATATAAFLKDCPESVQGQVGLHDRFAILITVGSPDAIVPDQEIYKAFSGSISGDDVLVQLEIVHAGYGGWGAYAKHVTTHGTTTTFWRGDLTSWAEAEAYVGHE